MGFMKCKRKLYHAEVMRRRANPDLAWNSRAERKNPDLEAERAVSRLHPKSSWVLLEEAAKYVISGTVIHIIQPL